MFLGGPENSKVSIVEINCTKASMTESIIKNIQSYHLISFTKKIYMTFYQRSLLQIDKTSLLEIFGSLKIRNFGYTLSWCVSEILYL